MKKPIVILLFLCLFNISFAQDGLDAYTKWHLKPAVGLNIPITNLFCGEITDNLFKYADNSYYWQVLSLSRFFSSKWGLEFAYQAGHSRNITDRADRFTLELQEQYGDKYFVSSSSGAQYETFSYIGGSIERGYLGLVYRLEKPHFVLLPKISIGVTSFYTDWGSAVLKEKGSNNVYQLSFDPGKRPNDHFTLAPSLTFGYRLSKRLFANIDILYSYYKTNIEYITELRNTFTGETAYETIDYKRNMHALTIGMGLIVELRNSPY